MDGSRIILLPNVETGLLVSIIADLSLVLLLLLCVSVVIIFLLLDGVSAHKYTQISVFCAPYFVLRLQPLLKWRPLKSRTFMELVLWPQVLNGRHLS